MPTRSFTGVCHRCGIEHSYSENTRIEWRDYCKDCRHEAKTLGWIPRSRKLAI